RGTRYEVIGSGEGHAGGVPLLLGLRYNEGENRGNHTEEGIGMAVLHKEELELERDGSRLTGLLVRPEGEKPLPGVVLIQEWWGIEPHIQDVAQRLAAEGFVVLVPDLYHGTVVTEPDEAGKHVMTLHGNLERALGEIQAAIK